FIAPDNANVPDMRLRTMSALEGAASLCVLVEERLRQRRISEKPRIWRRYEPSVPVLLTHGGHMKSPNWRKVLAPAAIFLAAALACGTTAFAQGSDSEEMQASANPDLWPSMGQNLALNQIGRA